MLNTVIIVSLSAQQFVIATPRIQVAMVLMEALSRCSAQNSVSWCLGANNSSLFATQSLVAMMRSPSFFVDPCTQVPDWRCRVVQTSESLTSKASGIPNPLQIVWCMKKHVSRQAHIWNTPSHLFFLHHHLLHTHLSSTTTHHHHGFGDIAKTWMKSPKAPLEVLSRSLQKVQRAVCWSVILAFSILFRNTCGH